MKKRYKLFVKDDEVNEEKIEHSLTTLILTMILICLLETEMIIKLTMHIFSDKTEICSTKSYSLVLIRLRILVKFYTIFMMKLN